MSNISAILILYIGALIISIYLFPDFKLVQLTERLKSWEWEWDWG